MNKPPLPQRFEFGDIGYELIYIPGLPAGTDIRYSVPPATDSMRDVNAGVQPVTAGDEKRFCAWRIRELPSVPGFSATPRMFLFLNVGKAPMDPMRVNLQNMVCYAMQPLHPVNQNPIQSIIDILLGVSKEPAPKQDDTGWGNERFSGPDTANSVPAQTEEATE